MKGVEKGDQLVSHDVLAWCNIRGQLQGVGGVGRGQFLGGPMACLYSPRWTISYILVS